MFCGNVIIKAEQSVASSFSHLNLFFLLQLHVAVPYCQQEKLSLYSSAD